PTGDAVVPPEGGWLTSPCLGLCDQAPAALLTVAGAKPEERLVGGVTPADAVAAVTTGTLPDRPRPALAQQGEQTLRLLRRVGNVDPTSIDDYRRTGGFTALERAIAMGPDAVIREETESRPPGGDREGVVEGSGVVLGGW